MLNGKTVAVVVPAYNEEEQICIVVNTMPPFVDKIVVVDDHSTDSTAVLVESMITRMGKKSLPMIKFVFHASDKYHRAELMLEKRKQEEDKFFTPANIINKNPAKDRLILIVHKKNTGVGAAIASGYKWCRDHKIACTAVMAGDGQMDPAELESICSPVINDDIDYVKGNRLIHKSAWIAIPRIRYLGNSILSALTKIASGYWHVSDTQTGFTAISDRALGALRLYRIYPKYGVPNDLLVKLNMAFCTIKEIGIKPVYFIGEKSKMKILRVIPKISWLLFKSFFKRLWMKYLFQDFHPLFIFYNVSFILLLVALPFGLKIFNRVMAGIEVNPITVLAFIFAVISGLQSLLFAMWMDIQDNERLYK